MSIKDRVTNLRKTKGLTRDELADKLGVHVNVIGRYERGETKPSLDITIKLAQILEVSVDYLVGVKAEDIDNDILDQVMMIQRLPEEEKKCVLFTLGALLRDAKARQAYSK